MSYDTSGLRQAVDAPGFPYKAKAVTLLHISADGVVTQAVSVGDKRAVLGSLCPGELLLGAWTGQWSTDLFVIDPDVMRPALGL